MPHLESNILALLTATGGSEGGLTAAELAESVYAPQGRVRMTLRRLLDRGDIWITRGSGPDTRYLPVGVQAHTSSHSGEDFGWGRPGGTDRRPLPGNAAELVARLERELAERQAELARLRADNEQLRAALLRRPGGRTNLDELNERVEALIQLCHPDRHDNSDRANEMTRWLLALRQGRRP